MKKLNELQSYLTRLRGLMLTLIILCSIGSGNVWGAKITDYNNIVSGTEYYIGATNSSTDYYWCSPQTTTGTGLAGTADKDKAKATIVILEGSGTSWKIKIKGTSNYVTLSSSKANGKFNIAESSNNWTFSNASGLIKMLYTGSYCLQKNNNGTQFGSYGGTQTNVWLEEAAPEYTITATRNNDSYGTVEVSGTTITATPAAGYRVIAGNDGYTVTSGSATVVNNGDNTFTVTPSSDCTVRINFESKGCTDHGASSITGGALSDADHGPLHAYYDYSTSQILYTKSDLDLAAGKKGTIKSIYFEYSGDAAMAARTIKIYMANTDLSSLTTSNYVPYASFTQVYSGTFSCGSAGWYEITLDTPFDYNGAGQLAVMIDDNTNTYESSKSFKYHSATGKQIYKRQDDTDIDPASWTPASAIDYRPNTKFCIQEADMTPATVTLMDNGATITEASAGAGVTLPSRAGCTGYTFAGWTKTWVAPQESWTTTAPTIIPAGSYTPTANENLYPVYTKTEGGGEEKKTEIFATTSLGSTNTVTTGYAVSAVAEAKSGYYQDGSGDTRSVSVSKSSTATAMISSIPAIATVTAKLGGGSTKNPLTNNVYAVWLDASGNELGDAVQITSKITNTTGSDFTANLPVANATSAYGVRIKHQKETGYNVRYYAISLSITTGGSTTSYISVPNCCTPLSSVNGLVSMGSTSATLTWDNIANVSSWAVTCKNTSTSAAAGSVGSITTNGAGKKTCTITDLTCGGTGYTFTISATAASGYCNNSWELTGSTTACTDPAITVSPTSLTGLNYIVDAGPSTAQNITLGGSYLTGNLTVSAPTNFEVSIDGGTSYGNSKTVTVTSGSPTVSTIKVRLKSDLAVGNYGSASTYVTVSGGGATTRNVSVQGSVLKPTITASPTSVSWSTPVGVAPTTRSVTVTGTHLKGAISAALNGTDAGSFSISTSSIDKATAEGAGGTITITYTGSYAATTTKTANIALTASDATTVNVPITFNVITDPNLYFLTNLEDIGPKDKVIIVSYKDAGGLAEEDRALPSYPTYTKDPSSVDVKDLISASRQTLSYSETALQWNIVYNSTTGQFTANQYGEDDVKLACKDDNAGVQLGTNYTNTTFTLETVKISGTDYLYIKNIETGRYLGVYNSNSWKCYNPLNSNIYNQDVAFYVQKSTAPYVMLSSSFSEFTYEYTHGPSVAQSFTVSGANLNTNLVVSAPTNYEVCKTADGTYTSTISYTPSDGAVANTTAYIRLAAGLNVGTYNYAAASGLQVTSTGAKTRTAALNGSVTKADCAITFTDFNAVDHYEATLEYGSSVTVSYNYTYNGDGNFSISRSPATGTINKANKTLTVSTAGIWTLNASATAGTNYSKPSDASAQIRVKCVDTYKDFIHNKTIKAYGSGTAVTDGKMEDWGSGYTVPYIEDNAEETSGSCQQTHYKFMGWVSEDDINIADGTFKTGWTLIQAGTESKLATTKTYYAVWAKLEE